MRFCQCRQTSMSTISKPGCMAVESQDYAELPWALQIYGHTSWDGTCNGRQELQQAKLGCSGQLSRVQDKSWLFKWPKQEPMAKDNTHVTKHGSRCVHRKYEKHLNVFVPRPLLGMPFQQTQGSCLLILSQCSASRTQTVCILMTSLSEANITTQLCML